jgi:hypothetical protein
VNLHGPLESDERRNVLLLQADILSVAALPVVRVADSKIMSVDVHFQKLVRLVVVGGTDPDGEKWCHAERKGHDSFVVCVLCRRNVVATSWAFSSAIRLGSKVTTRNGGGVVAHLWTKLSSGERV